MTETPEPTTTQPETTEPPGSTQPPTPETIETPETTEPESGDVAAVRREAANYRRQLRAAERERDALREQVDRRDRADAERLAGQTLASGADLWVGGVDLAQLRDEDTGALDPERVNQAVDRVLSERPHWRRSPRVSLDGGARRTPEAAPAHPFGEALKQAGMP